MEEENTKKSNVVRDAIATVDVSKYNLNIFDEVYAKVKELVGQKEFNAGNWITLLMMCMEMVETVPHLTGKEKRALVVDLLTKLIHEIPMPENDRALIEGLLSSCLPAIIDTICESSLGHYAINLADQAHATCSAWCGLKPTSTRSTRSAGKARKARK